jgi:hypothetical protein
VTNDVSDPEARRIFESLLAYARREGRARLESTDRLAAPGCIPANDHHAENSDHRDCVAAHARDRAAISAATATSPTRPMVPGGMERQRQLLRSRLRQSAAGNSQEWILPGRLARERKLLHSLNVRSCEHLGINRPLPSRPKPSRSRSSRDDCSPCHTTLAATNKSLAKSNKSCTGGKATKMRAIRQPA